MKISLITPCRNAAALLPDTLESVATQSAVLSGQVEVEHLVMDGASTDATGEVALRYPHAALSSSPDAGMYDALAGGLRRATGDIVGYLNAGDILHPKAFEVVAEVFAVPGVDWATGFSALVNDRLQVIAAWKPPRYRREFVQNGTYLAGHPVPGIMQEATFWSGRMNRALDLDKLATFRLAGDYFLWLQLAARVPLHSVESLLGFFRIHAGQLSEDRDAYRNEIAPHLRSPTRRERLTAHWEFRCNPLLRGPLFHFVLPPSEARVFRYESGARAWVPR
jgi:glycosyltransferase involved in cell wall biosynthesis